MLSPFTVLLASAVVASAGSSSAPAPTPSSSATAASSPYIPSGISQSCSSYLATLNTDTSLAGCTSALINVTSVFAPSSSSTSQPKSTITSTLDTLCSSSITDACPQNLLTGKLAKFQTECNAELVSSPNAQVKTIYDTFYSLLPLLHVVCAKDSAGSYCTLQGNATALTGASVASGVASVASSIRRGVTTAYLPNAAAIDSSNVMFLGLSSSASKDALCTDCTRSVLTAYLTFEQGTNYAPGLAQSTLMSGQSELYTGVMSTCGSDFLTSTVQAAGGLGTSGTAGGSGVPAGALSGAVSSFRVGAGALVGVVTMVVVMML